MKKIDSPLNYALYLLELRDRSIFEVRNKLKLKEFPENEIEETIQFLIQKKFLDDEKFAKNMVRSKSLSGEGKQKIKVRLIKAHISSGLIEDVLSNIDSDLEYKNALEIGQKILDRNKDTDRGRLYQKILGSLYRKGYDFDLAKKVFNELVSSD
ncbi:MAG: regulatory protein RecX [Patescibacteria group bacterium]|jgi:regulatory protein